MKIKLLVSRSGVNGSENRGAEVEVSDGEGERMIAAGQAERVEGPKVERAVAKAKPETRG